MTGKEYIERYFDAIRNPHKRTYQNMEVEIGTVSIDISDDDGFPSVDEIWIEGDKLSSVLNCSEFGKVSRFIRERNKATVKSAIEKEFERQFRDEGETMHENRRRFND